MADPEGTLDRQCCVPCRRGTAPPLELAEAERLLRQVPEWSLRDEGRRIERRFAFGAFADAMAFVTQVAAVAEAEDHHPDIAFGWGYATLSLHTHAIGGLHRNDFIVAAKADRLFSP